MPIQNTSVSALPTWDPKSVDAFHDATVGDGILEISGGCAQLVFDDQQTILLIWPEPTAWNPETGTISFVDTLGNQFELRAGDRIMPGGSTPVGEPVFVNPPNPGCTAEETFLVNSIQVVRDK